MDFYAFTRVQIFADWWCLCKRLGPIIIGHGFMDFCHSEPGERVRK